MADSSFFIGALSGLAAGFVLASPVGEDATAIQVFNARAAYITEGGQLCIRDIHQEGQPTVACVDYIIDDGTQP